MVSILPGQDPRKDRKAVPAFPGVVERDVVMVERVAADMAALAKALRKGDREACGKLFPRFTRLPKEAERIRVVARRAMARPEPVSEPAKAEPNPEA